MVDTSAESQNSSLVRTQDGNSRQLSVPVVVPPLILIDKESSEKKLLVLFALFKSLLEKTYSGDVLHLAMFGAIHMLQPYMDKEEAEGLCAEMIIAARRRPDPIDGMF